MGFDALRTAVPLALGALLLAGCEFGGLGGSGVLPGPTHTGGPPRPTTGEMILREDTRLMRPHRGTIVVARDGVVLDGAGFTVTGPGSGVGVLVSGRREVRVRNLQVEGFEQGVEVVDSEEVELVLVEARSNRGNGFHVVRSRGVHAIDVTARGNGANGFVLAGSVESRVVFGRFHGNTLSGLGLWGGADGNVVRESEADENGEAGFVLVSSHRNRFEENRAQANAHGFWVWEASSGNHFLLNAGEGNTGYDAVDSGDGVPPNAWIGNGFGRSLIGP
jgi:parallel beta-helix repeat protein